jgi:predicted ATPase
MKNAVFQNGATWLRTDFHLHTKADKEFHYSENEDFYIASYVEALARADIRIGVIANHNKFDLEEFTTLRNAASKRDVFLLPGVELSVSDGKNGVHVIVVFSDEWLKEGGRVASFLASVFLGKSAEEYQNENRTSNKNILETVDDLNKAGMDYFLYRYPAEMEGSDPKSIEEIGKGASCFLKLGAFTFEAVKFSLLDYENRLRLQGAPKISHSHIRQIRFEGGTADGQTVRFSPELNTLIGIRGSGKSSILEALRYGLDIPFGEKAGDIDYKEKLAGFTLGSGGKITIDAVDRYGQSYSIRRIWKEAPNVFISDRVRPGLTIRETVLHKPVYFGQKDLSNTGEGFEKDLVEKLLGSKLNDIRRRIVEQNTKVTETIGKLSKAYDTEELIKEQERQKRDAEHRLEFYKEHGLEEKLQKRLAFDADIRKVDSGVTSVEDFLSDLGDFLARHEDELRNFPGHASRYNAGFFKSFDALFAKIIAGVEILKSESMKVEAILSDLKAKREELEAAKRGFADEFAAIERKLSEELRTADRQNISPDDFMDLKEKSVKAGAALAELAKNKDRKTALDAELRAELAKLNELWHEEFLIFKGELHRVNESGSALAISVGFKENKSFFFKHFKSIFTGSNIHGVTLQGIVDAYQDFGAIYSDRENVKKMLGSNSDVFSDFFDKNLESLLTYQPPNKFTVTYHGKELADHSLGQRASALILFVLSRGESDVVIIDQPEDDLDNQTIYEDVIKLIRRMKPETQFIFATHNPNIPVLGDAEQVHACSFDDKKITIKSGCLDEPALQKKIVDIMEGGKEAFERRKEIYQIWKP